MNGKLLGELIRLVILSFAFSVILWWNDLYRASPSLFAQGGGSFVVMPADLVAGHVQSASRGGGAAAVDTWVAFGCISASGSGCGG